LQTTLRLRYETNADQLRLVLVKLRELLLAHPRILDEPLRVHFADLGKYALHVQIFAYVDTTDRGEFLAIREDVLLGIIDVVNDAGTGFALPSWTRDEASSLPPDFEPRYREKVEGTLD
jgi:small-conductance mechanosensitive channel